MWRCMWQQTLRRGFRRPHCRRPRLLQRHGSAGMLGRKNGRGFYLRRCPQAAASRPTRTCFCNMLKPATSHDSGRRTPWPRTSRASCSAEAGAASTKASPPVAADIELAMMLGTGYPPFRPLFCRNTPAPHQRDAAIPLKHHIPTQTDKAVLDTSQMSAGQRAALEMTEAAREDRARNTGFAATLFMAAPDLPQLLPFPAQSLEDRDQGDAFLARLKHFLDETRRSRRDRPRRRDSGRRCSTGCESSAPSASRFP